MQMATNQGDHMDQRSLDEVYSLAYEELRRLAKRVLRSDWGATVTPTTLVNEAWIKLARSPQVAHTSPLHFRHIVGRAMRQVLVDAARRRHTQIRGGGQLQVEFQESLGVAAPLQDLAALLTLDAALTALHQLSPRQAMLVEARFFGGLSWAEVGELVGISEATVMREWRAARAWLAGEMKRPSHSGAELLGSTVGG